MLKTPFVSKKLTIFIQITLSQILTKWDVNAIGLYLLVSSLLPSLSIGVIMADLRVSVTIPDYNEKIQRIRRG